MATIIDTVDLNVDLSKMLIGDIMLFTRLQERKATQADLVEFLQRVCGDDVLRVPIAQMATVVEKIGAAMGETSNPKAEG